MPETTEQWCAARGHPLVTWSPWINLTLCRCGEVRLTGERPMDWEAKRQIFHHCPPEGPCYCYTSEAPRV